MKVLKYLARHVITIPLLLFIGCGIISWSHSHNTQVTKQEDMKTSFQECYTVSEVKTCF